MRIIGIDPGRQHTAIVAWNLIKKQIDINTTIDMSLGEARSIRKYNPAHYRNDVIGSFLQSLIKQELYSNDEQYPVLLASVEDYIYGDKAATADDVRNMDRDPLKLAETHGVICASLANLSIPIIKPSASLMKYFMTGYGHADKRKMIKKVWEHYRVSLPDEHQYDALCAAHIARYFVVHCIKPQSLRLKSYESKAMNRLMFDRRFEGVGTEVRNRYAVIMSDLKKSREVSN